MSTLKAVLSMAFMSKTVNRFSLHLLVLLFAKEQLWTLIKCTKNQCQCTRLRLLLNCNPYCQNMEITSPLNLSFNANQCILRFNVYIAYFSRE